MGVMLRLVHQDVIGLNAFVSNADTELKVSALLQKSASATSTSTVRMRVLHTNQQLSRFTILGAVSYTFPQLCKASARFLSDVAPSLV